MTAADERAYVRRWVQTGRLLEDVRWQELKALTPAAALRASEALLSAAVLVPLSKRRRESSGLVELQRLLHIRRRA